MVDRDAKVRICKAMRTAIALLVSFLAAPAFALNVWFDPPNPDALTHVVAHVTGSISACGPVVKATHAIQPGPRNLVSITLELPPCGITPPLQPVDIAEDLGLLPAGVYDVSVGQEGILIGLGSATLAVRDANPAYRVMPDVGSIAGGDAVQIVGPNITFPCPGSGPLVEVCWPTIYIDDVIAERVQLPPLSNSMTVRTPAHTAGPVDVRIVWPMGLYRLSAAFDYYDPAKVPDAAFFTPALFPVVFGGDGAYGAKWQTEASLYNGSDSVLDTAPLPRLFNAVNFCVYDPSIPCDERLASHRAMTTVIAAASSRPGGYLMYVPRHAASQLSFGTRVRDLSRQSQDLGTEIPVVRESDLRAGRFSLVNVPTDARYRLTVRAYRLDAPQASAIPPGSGIPPMDPISSIRMRITPLFVVDPAAAPLVDTDIPLGFVSAGFFSSTINDLLAAYPQLRGAGPLRLEFDAATSRPSAWAMVSITNNETQHVTVVSPQ